uniref:Uncharacterized protein n=1 Tax=Rhizophora mucronata TaxID=61149 RepID=A0A2P2IZ25_RHIMU
MRNIALNPTQTYQRNITHNGNISLFFSLFFEEKIVVLLLVHLITITLSSDQVLSFRNFSWKPLTEWEMLG